MSSQTSVIVGIILLNDSVQLLDVAPVDMLGMISPDWLRFAQVPDEVVKKAPTFEFRFVNETGKGPNGMTAGFGLEVTDSIHTCPPLDIIVIGGPPPTFRPSADMQDFLRSRYEQVQTFITICTGYIGPLYSGLLDGKEATAPQGLLPILREHHPEVKWVERRWTRDGKLWTSGTVFNGCELMSAFMKEGWKKNGLEEEAWTGEMAEAVLVACDMPSRGRDF